MRMMKYDETREKWKDYEWLRMGGEDIYGMARFDELWRDSDEGGVGCGKGTRPDGDYAESEWNIP